MHHIRAKKRSHYVHNKDPGVWVRVWWTMENNPACTEHVRVFSMLKMDTMQKMSTKTAALLLWLLLYSLITRVRQPKFSVNGLTQ